MASTAAALMPSTDSSAIGAVVGCIGLETSVLDKVSEIGPGADEIGVGEE